MNQIKYFLMAVAVFMYSGCASVGKAGGVSQYVKQWDEKMERSRKGQYYDESTGLMWYVCSVGTGWRASSSDNRGTIGGCDNGYLYLNEEDTEKYIAEFINGKNFGGYSDWRLPTVFELEQIALANCRSWRQEKTGDVLTEAGRKPTYATATRTTLDNQSRFIAVDDCNFYNDDNVFDRAFGGSHRIDHTGGNLPYASESHPLNRSFRVRESAVSRKYQEMISFGSSADYLTSLKFNFENYESGLPSEKLAKFYIVSQHTPAKGELLMSKVYFIRTDTEAIERGCVGYGWGVLNFSEFGLLSDLLSAWKNLPNNDHYNWQQERQIVAFYTLSKGDIVVATTRNSKEIYIGSVKGDRFYEADLADGWVANLVTVDFIKDANGIAKAFSRILLSDTLQDRLGAARCTINDLQEYQDEIVDKFNFLQNLTTDKVDDNGLLRLAKLYALKNEHKYRILASWQEEFIAAAKLLIDG